MIDWTIHAKELDAVAQRLSAVAANNSLKQLEVLRFANGDLDVHASAYARAYHVRDSTGREACLRFWTSTPDPTFIETYRALSRDPSVTARALLPHVSLVQKAVVINGFDVPAVIMDWIAGSSLGDFITAHAHDRQLLYTAARTLLKVFVAQNNAGVSHGDLRASNVFLSADSARCHVGFIDLDSLRWAGGPILPRVVGGNRDWDDLRRRVGVTPLQHDYLDQALMYLVVVAVAQNPLRWPGATDDFLTLDYLDGDAQEVLRSLSGQDGVVSRIASAVREVTAELRPWPELAVAMLGGDPALPADEFWSTVFGIPGREEQARPAPRRERRPRPPASPTPAGKENAARQGSHTAGTPAPEKTAVSSPAPGQPSIPSSRQLWVAGAIVVFVVIVALIVWFNMR